MHWSDSPLLQHIKQSLHSHWQNTSTKLSNRCFHPWAFLGVECLYGIFLFVGSDLTQTNNKKKKLCLKAEIFHVWVIVFFLWEKNSLDDDSKARNRLKKKTNLSTGKLSGDEYKGEVCTITPLMVFTAFLGLVVAFFLFFLQLVNVVEQSKNIYIYIHIYAG